MEEVLKRLKVKGAYYHYDEDADVLYVHFGDRTAIEGVEIAEGVIVDLDENEKVAGLTITHFKTRLSENKKLTSLNI